MKSKKSKEVVEETTEVKEETTETKEVVEEVKEVVEETTEVEEILNTVAEAKQQRSRKFMFQRNKYYETHDKSGKEIIKMSDDEWKEQVLKEIFANTDLEIAEYIMLIFHDKDISDEETGELKKLHCHGILVYKNAQRFENIRNYTKAQSRNFEIIKSEASAVRYLTHTTEEAILEKKVRYNVSEIYLKVKGNGNFIVGQALEKFYREKISSKAKLNNELARRKKTEVINEAARQIINGDLKDDVEVLNYLQFWGLTFSDYSKNLTVFKNAFNHKKEVIKKEMLGKSRNDLRLIYVQGKSNVGKTKLAKLLARCFNVKAGIDVNSIFNVATKANDKTYDFFQNYNLEKSSIFDEQNLFDLGYEQFKQMFDKNNVATISSRFNNKLFLSDYNFIIKSEKIEKQIDGICRKEVDKVNNDAYLTRKEKDFEIENIHKQVKRRFDLIIEVFENKIELFVFNGTNNFKQKVLLKSYNFGLKEINDLEEDKEHYLYKKYFNQMNNSLFINDILNILNL